MPMRFLLGELPRWIQWRANRLRAERLGAARGALYNTLHDARHKLRTAIGADFGHDADQRIPRMREHLQGCPACAEEHATLRDLLQTGGATR